MNLLVTGGAGFIGSNLCLALRAALPDASITAMDNLHRKGSELNLPRLAEAGVPFHRGDVRDPSTFPPEPFDLMIECSAEPADLAGQDGSPDYLFQTNLVGAYHCLEACRRTDRGQGTGDRGQLWFRVRKSWRSIRRPMGWRWRSSR